MTKLPSLFKIFLWFIALCFILIIFSSVGEIIFNRVYKFPENLEYGVTFSSKYVGYLGMNWKDIFLKSLDELDIKNLRIPTYWDELEKNEGEFNFEDVDFMVSEIGKRGGKMILVVGYRQPRWPECYIPTWAKSLSLNQRRESVLAFIKTTLERYKNNPTVWAIQVENEPLLSFFGEGCDKANVQFLKREIDLVKSETQKPVIVTDSGELGFWAIPMQVSDIFGTTLYREVYNSFVGYTIYPLLPYFYNLKSAILRNIFAKNNQKTIIVELQTEPWPNGSNLLDIPIDEQIKLFPLEEFRKNVGFAKKTGFDTAYLWGVEWWYWMDKQGHPQYLEYAKTLFR